MYRGWTCEISKLWSFQILTQRSNRFWLQYDGPPDFRNLLGLENRVDLEQLFVESKSMVMKKTVDSCGCGGNWTV